MTQDKGGLIHDLNPFFFATFSILQVKKSMPANPLVRVAVHTWLQPACSSILMSMVKSGFAKEICNDV